MVADILAVLFLAQSARTALLSSLVDVLVLLFLVVAVKATRPLNSRATGLWRRGLVGKILVIVIAFLATATTSGFVFDLMKWGKLTGSGVVIGSLEWWAIRLTALGFIAALFFLLTWIGTRGKQPGP